ncbi:hypothetical protein SAMN05443572_101665 [Myxococcus fulvus]|uniref:DUF5636 domain-containing protein n=1 Tax=Myxococcus fulvus TaxID=33 RepID=A0A511SW59_MYXFU|nr:LirA/MavJ family T4SS effector [Myxococcus fulvus]GEN05787.1 hypothetical protein MFU01_08240 [Myxococcus fulvus]SES95081.1 hypothetical protein SAMN05443572_101665 [Myxococcus fulvus]
MTCIECTVDAERQLRGASMPITKNEFGHLYTSADWNSHEHIELRPRTRVLLTGYSSGEGVNLYLLVWAWLEYQGQLRAGWLWSGRIDPDTSVPVVNLREKYPRGDGRSKDTYKLYYTQRSRPYKNLLIEKLEAIQQLLADAVFVGFALDALETRTHALVQQGDKPTTALDKALAEKEQQWSQKERMTLRTTPKPKKPGSRHPGELTIIGSDGPLPFQRQFLKTTVKAAAPFRDIGAPVGHGEYAHRLQWYVIAFYFLPSWTPEGIRYAHHAMGRIRFLQRLDVPKRQDDPYRSLWDYVVDVRLSEAEEVGVTEEVFAASPVRLTSRILGYDFISQRLTLGSMALRYKTIAQAVANKRRKRALEDKQRRSPLGKSEEAELDDSTGYVAREAWLKQHFKELF